MSSGMSKLSIILVVLAGSLGAQSPDFELVLCEGRVVVAEGSPEGALVVVLPSAAALRATGVDLAPFDDLASDAERAMEAEPASCELPDWMPSTVVGPDGSFALTFPHVASRPVTQSDDWSFPTVAIQHAGCVTVMRGEAPRRPAEPTHLDLGLIAMPPEARLTGRVVDVAGQPAAGAFVRRLTKRPGPVTFDRALQVLETLVPAAFTNCCFTRTGADGRFVLSGFGDSSRQRDPQITVRHSSHEDVTVACPTLAAGESADLGEIALPAGGRVRGRVTNAVGEPLPGAVVTSGAEPIQRSGVCPEYFYYEDDDTVLAELRVVASDAARAVAVADGWYELAGIPDDHHHVRAIAPGYDPARTRWSGGGDLVLEEEAALIVRFVDADGQPIDGVQVQAHRAPAADVSTLLCPLEVTPLEGGRVRVGRAGRRKTQLYATAEGRGALIHFESGKRAGETAEIALVLPRASTLSGTLVDDVGHPLDGAFVEARAQWWVPAHLMDKTRANTRSDAFGRWWLGGLTPGDYVVSVGLEGKEPVKLEATLEEPGTDLFCALRDLAVLEVGVRDDRGDPVSDCTVTVRQLPFHDEVARTDERGNVVLTLSAGSWFATADTAEAVPLTLGPGEQRRVTLLIGSEPEVGFRVTRAGAPAVGVTVGLRHLGPLPITLNLVAGEGGRVTAPVPLSGRWEVRAWMGTMPVIGVVEARTGAPDVVTLDVIERTVTGRVTDTDGIPLAGVYVSVAREAGPRARGRTDDNGSYTVTWLASGPHVVSTPHEPEPRKHAIDIPEKGESLRVDIVLDRRTRLIGTVTGRDTASGCRPAGLTIGLQHLDVDREPLSRSVFGGEFEFEGLSSGRYVVEVVEHRTRMVGLGSSSARRIVLWSDVVEVAADTDTTLAIDLSGEAENVTR